MNKKALVFGLFLAVLATSFGGVFAADTDALQPQNTFSCTPATQSVVSGQWVTFSVVTMDSKLWPGYLTWSAPAGEPSAGTGFDFGTRFHVVSGYETRLVTVTDGYRTAVCTVYVYGPVPTDTPTPTPFPTKLSCSPKVQYVTSGQEVRFDATGYGSYFSWSAPEGLPTTGYGTPFFTRFYNYSSSTRTRTVTVTNGDRSATCTVYVYGTATPTPTVNPHAGLSIAQYGRNVTSGQSGEYASLKARANDTLDIIIRVRNTSGITVHDVRLTNILPAGLVYISGSTAVNGVVSSDGITTSGLDIDSLKAGREATVKFSVKVDASAVPFWGQVVVINNAQVRADGVSTLAAQMRITLGSNPVLGSVGQVPTGPADSILLALLISALVTGIYAVYTRTDLFGRRFALATIQKTTENAEHPNFLK